jgi:molybdopterin synthase catalytic subunit
MAVEELMRKLHDDAIDKFALPDARIAHRVGVVSAGE